LSAYWDVVAFPPAAPRRPEDLFQFNQLGPHPMGGEIELVIAHPDHWNPLLRLNREELELIINDARSPRLVHRRKGPIDVIEWN
jgi:hypothetical protein